MLPETIADLGITDLVVPDDVDCPFDFPCPGNPSQSCGCVFENGAVHPVVADVKDMGKLYHTKSTKKALYALWSKPGGNLFKNIISLLFEAFLKGAVNWKGNETEFHKMEAEL